MSNTNIFKTNTAFGDCYILFHPLETLWMAFARSVSDRTTPVFFKAISEGDSLALTCNAPSEGIVDTIFEEIDSNFMGDLFEPANNIPYWKALSSWNPMMDVMKK
jgi:hypothetical protein